MKKTAVSPMSQNAIEEFVEEFRKIFHVEDIELFPVLGFLEWFLPKLGIEIEIVEDWELKDVYAITDTSKGIIRIREDVYNRAYNGVVRDRFTICHEIGHAILHTPERVQFARGDVPAYRDSEWQANTFAAALLAPRNLAMGLSAEQISEKFGLSIQAAQIRYKVLHKNY